MTTHTHTPGVACMGCFLDARRTHLSVVSDNPGELLVCDGCGDLYDLGCPHGAFLCFQCRDRCHECRGEAAYEKAEDRGRVEW